MTPAYRQRVASADDVVPHETSVLTCPNGHTWELNPASLSGPLDGGKGAVCWAPACAAAPLAGVTAETQSRRALARRLREAVLDATAGVGS